MDDAAFHYEVSSVVGVQPHILTLPRGASPRAGYCRWRLASIFIGRILPP